MIIGERKQNETSKFCCYVCFQYSYTEDKQHVLSAQVKDSTKGCN